METPEPAETLLPVACHISRFRPVAVTRRTEDRSINVMADNVIPIERQREAQAFVHSSWLGDVLDTLPHRHWSFSRLTCRHLPAYHACTQTRLMDADKVFKALGDPTRRQLLDLLCEQNGQTLGQLCEHLDMARQSTTQHLGLLEEANLVSTVWRGREKLHFINPVPLHEVYERWVRKFERQRLRLLHDLKKELEGE